MKICSSRLTTCRASADGEIVELEFVDRSDTTVSLQLPFEQAEAVVMTLPSLLKDALMKRTGKPEARYVFSLGDWTIEEAKDRTCLLVTLMTTDAFEVCFGVPFGTGLALGCNLMQQADEVGEAQPFPSRTQ